MKRQLTALLSVAAITAVALGSYTARAQEGSPLATEEHKRLANEVGTWDADSKFWMTPDAEPVTSKAVEVNKMLGGMWILSEFKGDIMGMEFIGRGQFGYDPYKKKYVGTWIDSMTPTLSTMEGTMDEKTMTLTMMSKGFDPMTGKEETSKMVSKFIDKDHKTFAAYRKVEGQEDQWWKMMEINYTRKK